MKNMIVTYGVKVSLVGSAMFMSMSDAQAAGGRYTNTGGQTYSSSRVDFYGGGSNYKNPADSNSRPSYTNGGTTGNARYSGPGSTYNLQRMGYFSARNPRKRVEVTPVFEGDRAEYNRNHPDYYRKFWRSRIVND